MNAQLKRLRWALTAAKSRSIRQAAELLNVRQSTLSRVLRSLEAEVGVQLFDRSSGGTRLTVEGIEFLETVKRIVDDTETTVLRLRTRAKGESGRLTIGIQASPSVGSLRANIVDFCRRYPSVELAFVDGSGDRLISSITQSAIDIAFVLQGHRRWSDASLTVWSERLIVAVPEGHILSGCKSVQWLDLRHESLILPRQGPGAEFQHLIASKLCCHDQHRIVRQDAGLDRLLMLVAAGCGVLLALEGATGVNYPGVVYREIYDMQGPSWVTFHALWRERNNNPCLQLFLSMLFERYPNLRHPTPH